MDWWAFVKKIFKKMNKGWCNLMKTSWKMRKILKFINLNKFFRFSQTFPKFSRKIQRFNKFSPSHPFPLSIQTSSSNFIINFNKITRKTQKEKQKWGKIQFAFHSLEKLMQCLTKIFMSQEKKSKKKRKNENHLWGNLNIFH